MITFPDTQDVEWIKKNNLVGAVFSSVASSYDTMNDLMSLGVHRLWKDYFVRSLDPGVKRIGSYTSTFNSSTSSFTGFEDERREQERQRRRGWNILDVAGGTGDIALRILDHASKVHGDNDSRVTVADINESMLAEGRKRASSSTTYHDTSRLSFQQENAQDMPSIPDDSIDLYTVAFGIRNFTDKDAALREAYRVLRPGGVFACLEFSTPNSSVRPLSSVFDDLYRRWSFAVIPLLGQLVAGDRDSYQYLVESIQRFPRQDRFAAMIRRAGFLLPGDPLRHGRSGGDSLGSNGSDGIFDVAAERGKAWIDLSGGIAAIHRGIKPL